MPNEKAKTEGKEVKAEKPGLQQSLKTNSPKIAKSVFGAVLVEALKEKHQGGRLSLIDYMYKKYFFIKRNFIKKVFKLVRK